ncbi:MAG: RNA polymerase factor sigma-54 [Bacteroidales bacterium]|nr:RNA polymerase factor sigma-54 [Bacteroidales bacterium]
MTKTRLTQGQKLVQDLRLSPQHLQVIKLLELPVMELEEKIKEEIEENPALEEVTDNEVEPEIVNTNDFESENLQEENSEETLEDEVSKEEVDSLKNEEEFSFSDYLGDDEKEDIPYYLSNSQYSNNDEQPDLFVSSQSNFYDNLKEQIQFLNLDEKQKVIANYIIGSIDDKGYLQRETEAIVDDLLLMYNIKTSTVEVEHIIGLIQTLDPPGICARNIQENFIIQLKRKPKTKVQAIALEIVEKQFENLMKKHYNKIIEKLNIDENEFKDALNLINKLNINPADTFTDAIAESKNIIVPDFIVEIIDDEFNISLNSSNTPELRVNKKMIELYESLKKGKKKNKKELKYIEENVNKAQLFIDAIQQRQTTMINVMKAIVQIQKDFFYEGDRKFIKPMILKDVAEKTNYDISTISRVVSNKYVQTPYGIFPLKIFFSEALKTSNNEEVSVHVLKEKILEIIKNEDKKKPYTDNEIAKILKENGFNVARRTVTKYREAMEIPVARLRKEL